MSIFLKGFFFIQVSLCTVILDILAIDTGKFARFKSKELKISFDMNESCSIQISLSTLYFSSSQFHEKKYFVLFKRITNKTTRLSCSPPTDYNHKIFYDQFTFDFVFRRNLVAT